MRRVWQVILTVASPVLAWGCFPAGTYECSNTAQCRDDVQGTCEDNGFCSYPDASCSESGRRWGRFAGDGLAGGCVAPADTTGSSTTLATTTNATDPSTTDTGDDETATTETTTETTTGAPECGASAEAGSAMYLLVRQSAATPVTVATGDVDGDGVDDLVIGTPRTDIEPTGTGRVYVVFGGDPFGEPDLRDVAAGAGGFALESASGNSDLGTTVDVIEDVDGDGVGELLVGEPRWTLGENRVGRAVVAYGHGASAATSVADLPGPAGVTLVHSMLPNNAAFGGSAAGLGDFDGDGVDDLVIAELERSLWYVAFGPPDTAPDFATLAADGRGVQFSGIDDTALVARAAAAGDFDGDGNADALLGLPRAQGSAFVLFGGTPAGEYGVADLPDVGVEFVSPHAGTSLATVGDADGDGDHEVVITSIGTGDPNGHVYVVRGAPRAAWPASVDLAAIEDGQRGWTVESAVPDGGLGTAVAAGHDFDCDGAPDVLVGAPGLGAAILLPGNFAGDRVSIDARGDVSEGRRLEFAATGLDPDAAPGLAVAFGDLNGDGASDAIAVDSSFGLPDPEDPETTVYGVIAIWFGSAG